MKKYLLAALLAVGVTSFGATQYDPTSAVLPISASGEIIESDKSLVIEATTGGTVSNTMTFNFGQLTHPGDNSKRIYKNFPLASYQVKRADGSAVVDGTTYTSVAVKVGSSYTTSGVESTSEVRDGLTIKYIVGAYDSKAEILKGSVSAEVTLSTLDDKNLTSGTFTDVSQQLFVLVAQSQ